MPDNLCLHIHIEYNNTRYTTQHQSIIYSTHIEEGLYGVADGSGEHEPQVLGGLVPEYAAVLLVLKHRREDRGRSIYNNISCR